MTQLIYSAQNNNIAFQIAVNKRRNDLGFTITDVSKLSSISTATLSKWLFEPDRTLKSFILLPRLCQALEMDLEIVLGNTKYHCNEYLIEHKGNDYVFKLLLGSALAKARKDMFITQCSLAEKAITSTSHVAHIENAMYSMPRPDTIHRFFILIGAKLTVYIHGIKEKKC